MNLEDAESKKAAKGGGDRLGSVKKSETSGKFATAIEPIEGQSEIASRSVRRGGTWSDSR